MVFYCRIGVKQFRRDGLFCANGNYIRISILDSQQETRLIKWRAKSKQKLPYYALFDKSLATKVALGSIARGAVSGILIEGAFTYGGDKLIGIFGS